MCNECGFKHEEPENTQMSVALCGDCLYPLSNGCNCASR